MGPGKGLKEAGVAGLVLLLWGMEEMLGVKVGTMLEKGKVTEGASRVPPGEMRGDLTAGGGGPPTPPVSTMDMSSPEHWNTSMYLCFLPNTM
jgi:hypothetical protein